MHLPRHRLTTWLVTGLFAAVSAAGQGLHALPGCGHGRWLGECATSSGLIPRRGQCCDRRILTETALQSARAVAQLHLSALCPICMHFGQGRLAGKPIAAIHKPTVQSKWIGTDDSRNPTAFIRLFDARGPPLAVSAARDSRESSG